jgi:replicative DNA helicase
MSKTQIEGEPRGATRVRPSLGKSPFVGPEQCLLACMTLDKECIGDAIQIVPSPAMFYQEDHQDLFLVLVALYEAGGDSDAIVLRSELIKRKKFESLGGMPYLSELLAKVPSTLHFKSYAKIVRDTYLLRATLAAGNQMVRDAYDPQGNADEVVDRAEQRILEIAERRVVGGPIHVNEFATDVLDRMLDKERPRGIETGYFALDEMLCGLHDGDFVIVAARPSIAKTSIAMNFVEHTAVVNQIPTAVFSLEMNRDALMQRLYCQIAGVNGQRVRRRMTSDEENQKLVDAMLKVAQAPLFIDDGCCCTILELRAKVRKLKLKHGIRQVYVDYLQLMDAPEVKESRQQQVSAISRGLKAIAKDMNIPIIVLSQLNRASANRDGHRPEPTAPFNCVSGETRLIDAKSGAWLPIPALRPHMSVLSMLGDNRIVQGVIADVRSAGLKRMYRLITRTGKTLVATANHPVLTDHGWRQVGELDGSELIATARRLPPHGAELEDRFDRCRLLGYMAGNGTCLRGRSVGVIIPDDQAFNDALGIVLKHWPELKISEKPTKYHDVTFSRVFDHGYGRPYGNPLREWLREIGVLGERDSAKHVPPWVFEAGAGGAAEFLAGYLATDGCVKTLRGRWVVHFDTTSVQLAADVQALLLRIGVIASISKPAMNSKSTRPIFRISLSSSSENLKHFSRQVAVAGYKGDRLRQMVAELPEGPCNSYVDGLPLAVSSYTAAITGRRDQRKRMRLAICREIAETTSDPVLKHWAYGDNVWEDIRSIALDGEREACDLSVPGLNTYLANGIVVQSSAAASATGDVGLQIAA